MHSVCKEQYNRGSKDFSIPTIARLSTAQKGPSEQTIRNKTGEDYQALISCWANYSGGSLRKPNQPKETSIRDEILSSLTDPTSRALVGIVLSENTKLKGELSAIKRHSIISTDMRGAVPVPLSPRNVDVSPSFDLCPLEIEALTHAISPEQLKEQGWISDEQGRIKEKGRTIFKIGFVSAIKKILDATRI